MGALFRAQLPPEKSLFTHPQELIPAVSEACLPTEAGAHRLANANKRGIVCWEPVKRLCQPFSRGSGSKVAPLCLGSVASPSPELCRVQLCRGCCGRWAGPCQGSCSWEKCFHQSYPQVENQVFEGKYFQSGGRGGMLSAEVRGLVCWKHAGRSRGVPQLHLGSQVRGALMESCIQ